jgi:hypothetical protein
MVHPSTKSKSKTPKIIENPPKVALKPAKLIPEYKISVEFKENSNQKRANARPETLKLDISLPLLVSADISTFLISSRIQQLTSISISQKEE